MSAPTNPYASAPADAFQLLPESQKAGEAEDALYDAQIKEVEAWWSSPRYAGIKRPYTAADIVSKRGTQTTQYPSSVMASKLFSLIRERESKGEPIHTRMCLLADLFPGSEANQQRQSVQSTRSR